MADGKDGGLTIIGETVTLDSGAQALGATPTTHWTMSEETKALYPDYKPGDEREFLEKYAAIEKLGKLDELMAAHTREEMEAVFAKYLD